MALLVPRQIREPRGIDEGRDAIDGVVDDGLGGTRGDERPLIALGAEDQRLESLGRQQGEGRSEPIERALLGDGVEIEERGQRPVDPRRHHHLIGEAAPCIGAEQRVPRLGGRAALGLREPVLEPSRVDHRVENGERIALGKVRDGLPRELRAERVVRGEPRERPGHIDERNGGQGLGQRLV